MTLVPSPLQPAELDYETIEAAVLETERGRWFLAEHARRNRQADTMLLLKAIERLEHGMDARLASVLAQAREHAEPVQQTTRDDAKPRPGAAHAPHPAQHPRHAQTSHLPHVKQEQNWLANFFMNEDELTFDGITGRSAAQKTTLPPPPRLPSRTEDTLDPRVAGVTKRGSVTVTDRANPKIAS